VSVWVDTSAFVAGLDERDPNHALANRLWARLLDSDATILCSNYVILETLAVLQRRLGMTAVERFVCEFLPALDEVPWVGRELHSVGISLFRASGRKGPSLVDCVSFIHMRQLGISEVLAFDPHFEGQGLHCLTE